ncbi:hypothetical protein GPICK_15940 [Geobacter pickeringii]|uniref:Uncharacterized protein n=1 Tax=Geobacter pickeringii TaxID=345632 RepID=A0A0B5BEU1_9BACT|nr:hypothetical protein GPICK_15940 [Geobacter pickeringii]
MKCDAFGRARIISVLALAVLACLAPMSAQAIQCYQCHGTAATSDYRPVDATYRNLTTGGFLGSHRTHMATGATPTTCTPCHGGRVSTYTTSHRNGFINLTSNIKGSPAKGVYSKGTSFAQSATPTLGTCSSVNCHFESATPAWSTTPFAAPADCNKCHGAAPADGGHPAASGAGKKHGDYYGLTTSSCIKCHPDHTAEATPFAHATSAGKRGLLVQFTTAPNGGAGAYGGTVSYPNYLPSQSPPRNGSCRGLYCHSNGNRSFAPYTSNTTATWGGSLTCTGCHGGNAASGSVIATGKHRNHIDPSLNVSLGTGNGLGCVQCHAKTVSNDTTIGTRTNHVNKFKDYSGAMAYGPSHYDTTAKQCTNIYCHSNGNPGALVFVSMTSSKLWTGNATLGCNGCHGRSNPNTGAPDYANGGIGSTTANNHAKHVAMLGIADSTGCYVCHRKTVAASTANRMRNYSTLHMSGAPNVAFNSTRAGVSATWTSGTATCTNVTCHSNGRGTYQSPQWGQSDNCGFCHPIASLGGAHAKHLDLTKTPVFYTFTANRSSGDDTTGKYYFGCSNCHPLTNSNHTSGTIVLDFRPTTTGISTLKAKNSATITAFGPVGTANGGTSGTSGSSVVCAGVYCHSNGYASNMVYASTPNWYGGSFTDRCASCHGNSPNSTIAGSPAHYNTNFLGTGVAYGHFVGIHYSDIFNGAAGEMTAGTGASNSHGNSSYSTTINCNICHNLTVTSPRNDSNVVCKTCHYSGNTIGALVGNNAAIANKANHVSGQVNVAFSAVAVLSKAQVRSGAVNGAPYNTVWTRQTGYKVSGADDLAQNALNTTTMWNSGTKTCSNVACHNGQSVKWTDTGGVTTCASCHTDM